MSRERSLNPSPPWMSYCLLAAFVGMFMFELWQNKRVGGHSLTIDSRVLIALGANYSPAVLDGEYWRLLTSCFLHADGAHILFNGLGTFYFGRLCEERFGPWLLLTGFLLTGVLGSTATIWVHRQEVFLSLGASGGLYGLFGVMFLDGKRYRKLLSKSYQVWLNQNLGLMLIVSFVPHVDAWAHIGGFVGGLLLGGLFTHLRPLEALIGPPADADAAMAHTASDPPDA